jgi:SMI1 / KNR4 family (SUKH-1)
VDERVGGYIARYQAAGLTGVPCTEAEVSALQRDLGVRLPAAYRAMLLLMGREPDPSFTGTDLSMRWLRDLQPAALELLEDNGRPFELPPRSFVFLSHQGYQFMYLVADGASDDPPLYYYREGTAAPERRAERFSDWLIGS